MINYLVILLIVTYLFINYRTQYFKGFNKSIFFLILSPSNLSIELGGNIPSLTIHRIILMLMIIQWLNNKDIKKEIYNVPFIGMIILITITTGISVLLSVNILVSVKRYFFFIFESFMFFLVVINSFRDNIDIKHLLKTIIISLTIVASIGIIEKYTGYNPTILFGQKHSYEFETIRELDKAGVQATYQHRILFGIAMTIGAIYSIFILNMINELLGKILYWITLFAFVAALYFSTSRGPWIAFVISIFIMCFFYHKPIIRRVVIITCIILSVFLIRPGTLLTIQELFFSTFNSETVKGSSYLWRFQVLNMALTKVTEGKSILNFFFGYGHGSHLFLEFPVVQLSTGHYAGFYSWDNEFAVILLEHGFIGIGLYLLFYILIIKRSFTYYINNPSHRDLVLLALTSLIVIMFMKTNVKIFTPQLVYLEFINLAIISSLLISGKSVFANKFVNKESFMNPVKA